MLTQDQTGKNRWWIIFIIALAVTPFIAITVPRFLAYWPGFIGVGAFLPFLFQADQKVLIPRKLLAFVITLLFLVAVSNFWALDPGFALSRTFKMTLILIPGLLLMAVVNSVKTDLLLPYMKYFFWAIVIAAFLASMEMLADYPLYRLIHGMDAGEVVPSQINRSVIALLALFFTAYALADFYKRREMKLTAWAVFGILLALTHSQSAQLGAILALICFVAFPYNHKNMWHALAVILIILLCSAPFLAIWMFDHLAASIDRMPFFGQGGGFGADRLEIWDGVARYALQNPLYGYGIEATRAVEDFDIEKIYRQSATALHPHNFALQIWIEFGLIGIALFSAGFIALVKEFSQYSYDRARIALPTFMVLLSAAAFGYGLWQSWFLGLIIFIMAISRLVIRFYDDACNPH